MESPSSDKFISVTAKIVSTNPLVIESDQLITFKAVNKETGQLGIGYILKSEKAEKNLREASATPCYDEVIIETGYFYYGHCLVYGTYYCDRYYVGFFPCTNCIGFDPICPPGDDGYTRMASSSNQSISLRFPK